MLATQERVNRLETVFEEFVEFSRASQARLDAMIARHDATLGRHDRALFNHEAVIARLDSSLARHDTSLFDHEAVIARLDETVARTERASAEANARAEREWEEAGKAREEAQRERRELFRQMGEISNRLGTVVEDLIVPSLRRMAEEELGCGELEFFAGRVERRHAVTRQRREFDAIGAGDKAVLFNWTKTTARPEYAKEFVEFLQSGEFFNYFPEYAGRPVVPVFSTLALPEEVLTYLTRHTIFAVGMGDDAMEILNLKQLRPDG